MASDIGHVTPLKTIVAYFLDECGKSFGDEDQAWLLGLRCLVELNFDISAQPKTVRIPKDANQTVPFPSDCLSWSKVGILDHNGQINTLKINNALTTWRDLNPNRLGDLTPDINTTIGTLSVFPYYANFYYNGGLFQLFGLGNGLVQYGECRVDEDNRVVILAPDFKYDDIMFEYISSPQKSGDYPVPTYLQEAVIAFIKYKMKLGTRDEYTAEVIKARRRQNNKKVILQTLNQVLRESQAQKLRS